MKKHNGKGDSNAQRQSLVVSHNAGALTKHSLSTKAETRAAAEQSANNGKAGLETPPASIIPPSPTVAEAVDRFCNRKVRSGTRALTLFAAKALLDCFLQQFGNRPLASISTADIMGFIDAPVNNRGLRRPPSGYVKRTKLQLVKAMFRRHEAPDIPFPAVHIKFPCRPRVIQTFSVGQVETMFRVAKPNQRGALALAIFALFRPQELEWMPAAIVDLKTRRIHIPRNQSLDGRSIILSEVGSDGDLPCLPPVLFDWLEKYPFTPQPWGPIKGRLANALGFWIPHACRHTGIANCAAAYGNVAAVMLTTREKNPGGINGRPMGIVSPSEAKRFYALTPRTVITAR